MRRSWIAAATTLAAAGCGFSPLSHRISVGEEPLVVFVGEGVDHNTDLFAVRSGGGEVVQVTFTPLVEMHPRLVPAGNVVAFLRMRDTLAASVRDVVMMNLATGGEFVVALPGAAGQPRELGWNPEGNRLYIRTDHGLWEAAAAPGSAATTAGDTARADSALANWLGDPPFARAVACAGAGLCVIGPKGDTTSLAPGGSDVMRWGSDSVAWFENSAIVVRPVGPGRERNLRMQAPPAHPRDASYAAGRVNPPR